MARIKFSPIVSSVSGSIGSATIQRCSAGHILKNKQLFSKQGTHSQNLNKVYLSQVQSAWNNLSDTNRSLWNNFINLSKCRQKHNANLFLSSYNLFLKYNLIRLHSGGSILSTPSFDYNVDNGAAPIVGYLSGSLTVDFQYNFYTSGTYYLLKLTKPISPGSSVNNVLFRCMPRTWADAGYQDVNTLYQSVFNMLPSVNDYIYVRIIAFNTNAPVLSPELTFQCIVESW